MKKNTTQEALMPMKPLLRIIEKSGMAFSKGKRK